MLTPLARSEAVELLDEPEHNLSDLAANLADIRRLNRFFGGTMAVTKYLPSLLQSDRITVLLDVATGSADIPLAIKDWGRSHNSATRVLGADSSRHVLLHARRNAGKAVELVQCDARALPHPDAAVDVVMCCLALHHFPPSDARQVLAELWRVSRSSVLVVDLIRTYTGFLGAILLSQTVARNRLTRHDGPLSVRRAYRPPELRALALQAGLRHVAVHRHLFSRQSLIAHHDA